MVQEMGEGVSDKLWMEIINYVYDQSNACISTSLDSGVSPFEKWYGEQARPHAIYNPSR